MSQEIYDLDAPEAVIDGEPEMTAAAEEGEFTPHPDRIENADGSVTLPLLYPIDRTLKGADGKPRTETLSELVVKRIKGQLLINLMRQKMSDDKQVLLGFSALTGLDEGVFNKLDLDDIFYFLAEWNRLGKKFLKTGGSFLQR